MYPPPPVAPSPIPPPPTPSPPVPAPGIPARIGTAIWRLAVAGCAFFGVYEIAYDPVRGWDKLHFLSQSGSLIAAICFAVIAVTILIPGGERLETAVTYLRGSLTSTMLLICIVSIFILDGGALDQTGFLFEHLITPLIITADFIFVGRAQLRAKAWQPLTWIAIPLGYLIYVNMIGKAGSIYGGMLSAEKPTFLPNIAGFLAGAIVLNYLVFGLTKLRGTIAGSNRPPQPLAMGMPPGGHPMPHQFNAAPQQAPPPQAPFQQAPFNQPPPPYPHQPPPPPNHPGFPPQR